VRILGCERSIFNCNRYVCRETRQAIEDSLLLPIKKET